MGDWLQWGINLITVTAIGLIGWFAKRTLNQIDERQKNTESKILAELERYRTEEAARHAKAETRIERVEERLNHTLQELPTMYTLREDWLRTSSAIDRKLDKIMDLLMGRKADE